MRESRFLALQVFCFRNAARWFSVTSDSSSKCSLPLCALPSFRLPSCGLGLIFSWPPTFADFLSRAIAPAFAAAPFAGFTLARETHRPENQTAPITNRVGEGAVFLEKLAALLNSQVHGFRLFQMLAWRIGIEIADFCIVLTAPKCRRSLVCFILSCPTCEAAGGAARPSDTRRLRRCPSTRPARALILLRGFPWRSVGRRRVLGQTCRLFGPFPGTFPCACV